MLWESIWNTIQTAEFWKYASIPFISAAVGWATNVLALKMTFYPLKFIGVWKIGWQGIIPSKAGRMAGKAVDLLTQKLITIEERFSQIEPERVAEEMEPALNQMTMQIIDQTMEEEAPLIWETAPGIIKDRIYQKASEDLPEVVENLMTDVKTQISDLFDLRKMVVEELENDPDLLNQIFLKVGSAEFRFIERSGIYFGFLFGIIQMLLFLYVNRFTSLSAFWILPFAGLFVGWATNVIALADDIQTPASAQNGFLADTGAVSQKANGSLCRVCPHRHRTHTHLTKDIRRAGNRLGSRPVDAHS